MNRQVTFGSIVKDRRHHLDLTQAELARRASCAAITVRKIEANDMRPSRQIVEHLAKALKIPEDERLAFARLAWTEPEPTPIPAPKPVPDEIGQEDLTGRAIKGFELGERIAVGGFGAVYRAIQPSVEREVAIKIILPQYADHPDFIRRFEAEAQLVARLEHPYIVPLYDYWREPTVAYLVMRLMRGGSLQTKLKGSPLPLETTLRLIQEVGSALHSAHRAGVIHRDLKPANILLDEDDNGYLADFGFAKSLGNPNLADQTEAGAVIGSLAYISPEQIQAEPVTPQSDIYCLGIVFYELLTGQKPFPGPTPIDFIQQHLNQPLPSLDSFQANGGDHQDELAPLNPIIARATAKNPRDRYPDVEVMLADIRQLLQLPDATSIFSHRSSSKSGAVEPYQIDMENPFKGLRAFSEADAASFFGRDTLVQDLLGRLSEETELAHFLAVVGPSGSGKSSVVKAGLIPILRQGGLPGSDNWFIVEMMPGSHPLEELEAALLRVAVNPPDSLVTQLQENKRGLLRAVRRILPDGEDETDVVLVIDQFEEIFTQCDDETIRAHFLDSLVTATLDPHSKLWVVITLRADFIDRPLQYVDFGELVGQRSEFVLPLTSDELEEAITKPAQRAGLSLEPGLVATIIRDLGNQPGTLPLLQYTLTELFERRVGNALTLGAYQTSGGVRGALASRADEIYDSLNKEEQHTARQLFLRLVTLGEGTEDTRRRVLRSELASLTNDKKPKTNDEQAENGPSSVSSLSSVIDKVIEQFGRYRLLTFDHDPVTRGPTVEVAHEALLREWERLRDWLDESRSDIRLQRLLSSAATEWKLANRDPSYLLRGSRLDQFEGWAATTTVALAFEERKYLRTSINVRRARQAEEEARQKRELETAQKLAETEKRRAEEQSKANFRLRWLAVGLAAFLVLAIGAAWFAFSQQSIAHSNFIAAERIRLAAQAQIALDNGEGGDLPALLALRSLQNGYSPEADAALLNALKRGFTRQRYLGHAHDVLTVEFSPDGRYVLTASADRTARLWDAQTGRELRQFIGHTATVNAAIFSPDGRYVLTGSHDNTARLWEAETGRELRQFSGHTGGIYGIDFTPDGQYALTSDGTMARLWQTETGEEIQQFTGHTGALFWADLSSDGRLLVTVSNDNTARLWDVQTGRELRQFLGHTDWVGGGRFSPDDQYILTTSGDQTARIWNVQTGQEVRRFVGHTDIIFDGIFSPDGQTVLTGSFDKSARLWDIASGQEIRQFLGHTDFVGPVMFSTDGQLILTGSGDRSARLWDVYQESEPRNLASFSGSHAANLNRATIAPDNRYVLTGWSDGAIRLVNNENGEVDQEIKVHGVTVNAQVMSAGNRLVLSGDSDGLVYLADAQTGRVVREFVGHTGPIWDVSFSPDGKHVLTGSEDKTLRLWDAQTGQELQRLSGHDGPVNAVTFSPDGRYILSSGGDNTARLWNVQTGREIRQFDGHTGAVLDVAFSNDGQFILTGGADETARLWEAETGQELRQFVGHTEQVSQVAFSPDDRTVLTGSADQTARLWHTETGQIVRQFVGHNTPLQFVTFSDDGRYVFTGDSQSVLQWHAILEDVVTFSCEQLSRDLTGEERALYNITDPEPTCPEFAERSATPEPTWTPVSADAVTDASPLNLSVEIEFINESGNIQMGVPVQDVFVDAGNGQVERVEVLNEETLALPVYRSAVEVELDSFEAPFDTGPYPKGEPLGFTLGDYVSVTGRGSYTVRGERAIVELTFEHLVPGGVYTMWCNTISFKNATLEELPCLSPDGVEYDFIADETGHGEISMDLEAFPPSTEDAIYEIAVAYHSDGQTHGNSVGAHGMNAHGLMFFDFMPPESPAPASPALNLSTEFEFANESGNIQMGVPVQDAFVDIGNGQVVRPEVLNAETLAMPAYRTAIEVEPDFFEEPFDTGPYPRGEPLGFTLGDYVAAEGHGIYTINGERATVEMTFDHLVPNGVYTMWCNILHYPIALIEEYPCRAPDGTPYSFIIDENGHAELTMNIEAFPPSTEDDIYEIGIAYHSDGQTHGDSVGAHGLNAHGQMFFDFLPPEE